MVQTPNHGIPDTTAFRDEFPQHVLELVPLALRQLTLLGITRLPCFHQLFRHALGVGVHGGGQPDGAIAEHPE
ncbi:hypothetical protein NP493_340g02016 [Ridgeia piscesae]|uniref:Uncharacterized protein n=1 Tax=Ridgeia piscesae TaxID=27915 RepID=A0AAD9L4J9_RIDPI|nr:hypothetical protein NP493_340g02016 [Ridgeia piscesae]